MLHRRLLLIGLCPLVLVSATAAAGNKLDLQAKDCHEMRDKVLAQFKKFHLGTTEDEKIKSLDRKCHFGNLTNEIAKQASDPIRSECPDIFARLSQTIDDADRIHDEACALLDKARDASAACADGQAACMKEPATYFKQAAAKLQEVQALIPKAMDDAQRLRDAQKQGLRDYSAKLRAVAAEARDNPASLQQPLISSMTKAQYLAKFEGMTNPTPEQIEQRASTISARAENPGAMKYDDGLARKLSPGLGPIGGEGLASVVAANEFRSSAEQINRSLSETVSRLNANADRTLTAGSSVSTIGGKGGLSIPPAPSFAAASPPAPAGAAASTGGLTTLASNTAAPSSTGASRAPTDAGGSADDPMASPGSARAFGGQLADNAASVAAPAERDFDAGPTAAVPAAVSAGLPTASASPDAAGSTGIQNEGKIGAAYGTAATGFAGAVAADDHAGTNAAAGTASAARKTKEAEAVLAGKPFVKPSAESLRDSLRRALASARDHSAKGAVASAAAGAGVKTIGEVFKEMPLGEMQKQLPPFRLGDPSENSDLPGVLGPDSRDLFGRVRSAHRRFENRSHVTVGSLD